MANDQVSLDTVLTEKELLELLAIKRTTLDVLRQKERLPFCKLSNVSRIYLVKDVLDFIESKRIILNRG
tara:strand:+ start:403 stop:609 length:207 start_codon:yes stop_codon:yes gene_type:complete